MIRVPRPLLGGCLLVAVSVWPASAQPSADELVTLVESQLARSWPLLRSALTIPNDAHFPDHVEANVAWAEKEFGHRGFETTRLETGGPPILLATRPAAGPAPTVMIYLQLDGQPVDPSRWEQRDPYQPVLKKRSADGWVEVPWTSLTDGYEPELRVFARSASDAKGPVVMLLSALDILAAERLEPSFGLKVIMDFEEELGSPHLPAALDAHRQTLAADWLLIFDGPRHASNRPTLTFGARGIVDLTLTVFGPRSPQHSGHYGNYAPNPALRLAQLLASMKNDSGRVTIPGFYDGVELSDEVRSLLARTPDDEAEIRRQIGIAEPDHVGATYQEAIQYPSLNVRGMAAAWIGDQARTVIPERATAEIDIRLVPESDAERLVALVRRHIESQGYHVLDGGEPSEEERLREPRIASLTHFVAYGPFRTSYDSGIGLFLRRALTRAFGEEPVLIRSTGGSIPIAPFVVELGLPAVAVPTVNRDNNQHSPNENLRLGNFVDGVRTYLAILTEPPTAPGG